jgi:hypothetical protein
VYLQDRDKILDDNPLLNIKLVLTKLESTIPSDVIKRLAVLKHKLEHVVSRIPAGDNIAWNELDSELVS